jgi:hypothetical protein
VFCRYTVSVSHSSGKCEGVRVCFAYTLCLARIPYRAANPGVGLYRVDLTVTFSGLFNDASNGFTTLRQIDAR